MSLVKCIWKVWCSGNSGTREVWCSPFTHSKSNLTKRYTVYPADGYGPSILPCLQTQIEQIQIKGKSAKHNLGKLRSCTVPAPYYVQVICMSRHTIRNGKLLNEAQHWTWLVSFNITKRWIRTCTAGLSACLPHSPPSPPCQSQSG